METGCAGGNPWGKAVDLSEVHELLSFVTYQQLDILLERESKRVWRIRQDEEAITKTKRDRRREWFEDMRLFARQAVQSVLCIWRRKPDKKAVQTKRDRRREWLTDVRLVAYAMGRSVVSFWGIVGWVFLGTVFGTLMAHNFMSRAVLCNQPLCMWLRLDGEKVLE